MIIGLVSDSHGLADILEKAIDILIARGVQAMVHCGDLGSAQCIVALGRSALPSYAVSGNMDRHLDRLSQTAGECGVDFNEKVIELLVGPDARLAATHGDDETLLKALILSSNFRYVCHGHTHRIRDERIGQVRVICPGALRRPKHPRHPTAAVLDTDSDSLEYLAVLS